MPRCTQQVRHTVATVPGRTGSRALTLKLAAYLIAFSSGGGIGTLPTYITQTRSYDLEREKWEHERSSHEREDRVRSVVAAWAATEKLTPR